MQKTTILLLSICLLGGCNRDKIIFENDDFTLYNHKVVQGEYEAIALSTSHIVSTYRSEVNNHYPNLIHFKFSINSRDNELEAGTEHQMMILPQENSFTSPILTFGSPSIVEEDNSTGVLLPNTTFTVRVDMNPMLRSFEETGSYVTPTGDIIYKGDFKGVYIAGENHPLTWDFENLYGRANMELIDPDGNGIYQATIILNPSTGITTENLEWRQINQLKDYPQYHSGQKLIDALYNMSLDEMMQNIEPDGTLRTGEAWGGIWTRDISYSIYLAMAYINPKAAKLSLMAKIKNHRIIQDTGTGGAWPISTDRMIWSIAAWELYKVTGDNELLTTAWEAINNSIQDDEYTIINHKTGLRHGEESYLDWREQSYPRWMQPIDIYQSQSLSTNIIHCQTYQILSLMAPLVGSDPTPYVTKMEELKVNINRYLWNVNKGYYGAYLYGDLFPIRYDGIDNLGESLAILFEVANAEQAAKIIESVPVCSYGTTAIYPQLPLIKPYHNNSVWPFVQSYWNLAAAKANNEAGVVRGIAALYRAAALFATNKELFVASTGDFKGTAINSDRMLWSLSGNIAMIYRLYAGMRFETDGIYFSPFVPDQLAGKKKITDFKYRKSILDIEIIGSGNKIAQFEIDGKQYNSAFFGVNNEGRHHVKIWLDNKAIPSKALNVQSVEFMPPTPQLFLQDTTLSIENYNPTNNYMLLVDGKASATLTYKTTPIPPYQSLTQYSVIAQSPIGWSSFMAAPITLTGETQLVEIEPLKNSYIELTTKRNTMYAINVKMANEGFYYCDLLYSNGNGPINTNNSCALRTLFLNGEKSGVFVMPQRGENEWENVGYSNPIGVKMKIGNNKVQINYILPYNRNMNGENNGARIFKIRFRKI